MELINVFFTFFKIGAFSFGGGYSIISLLGNYLEQNNWLTNMEYSKIVTISQMTPGPIVVNTATFVGAKLFNTTIFTSLFGSFIATLGVILPSFFTVIIVAKVFDKISSTDAYNFAMKGIRASVIGFMFSAILFFGQLAFVQNSGLNYYGIGIFILCFCLSYFKNIGAFPIIIGSAIIGLLVF